MAYTPQTWADGEAGGTPLSAARLNHIEQGIGGVETTPGPKGDKGDPGNPGAKGDKGDKGDPGNDAEITPAAAVDPASETFAEDLVAALVAAGLMTSGE